MLSAKCNKITALSSMPGYSYCTSFSNTPTQSIKSDILSHTISQPFRIVLETTYQHQFQCDATNRNQTSVEIRYHIWIWLGKNLIEKIYCLSLCGWLVYGASFIPSCLTDLCVLWIRPCLGGSWADGPSDVVWRSEEVSSRSTSACHPLYDLHWDDAHRSRWVSIGLLPISIRSTTALKLSWDCYGIVLIHVSTAMWIIVFTPR